MKDFLNKKSVLKQGFTLTEMLITVFIITLIGIAVISFQIDLFSLNRISSDNLNSQTDARKALKTMVTELRSMSPSNNGSYAISLAGTSSITFYVDIDNDSNKEQIRYFQDGVNLKKGIIKPVNNVYNSTNETITILVSDLANGTSSIFYYYDKNYNGETAPLTYPLNIPSIRLVKINILIDKDITRLPTSINVTTQVSLRNLKDNL